MTTKLERQDSVISILSSGIDLCRICHCDSSCGELISPCYCSGSMRWVHQVCLQHWIRASNNKACELCRYPYCMRTKMKPPCYWESLPMSPSEKRRLFCSAIFHLIALGCVIWSLYVLIDRTIDEVYQSELEWQFWTKIVVEAIGCIGAGILIYVWGKSYFSIINKWVAFNRTFIIVSSSPPPIKKPLPSSAVDTKPKRPSTSSTTTNTAPTAPSATMSSTEPLGVVGVCHSCSGIITPAPAATTGIFSDNTNSKNNLSISNVSSPVATTIVVGSGSGGVMEGIMGIENSDGDGCGCDTDSGGSDKSREAKALLLPPVVYQPKDFQNQ